MRAVCCEYGVLFLLLFCCFWGSFFVHDYSRLGKWCGFLLVSQAFLLLLIVGECVTSTGVLCCAYILRRRGKRTCYTPCCYEACILADISSWVIRDSLVVHRESTGNAGGVRCLCWASGARGSTVGNHDYLPLARHVAAGDSGSSTCPR